MPEIKFFPGLPALNVSPCIQPFGNPFESIIGVRGTSAQLYDKTEFLRGPAPAVTSVGLNGFINKGIQEIIQTIVTIAEDDDSAAPLGELATMFLFSKSPFHVQCLLDSAVMYGLNIQEVAPW